MVSNVNVIIQNTAKIIEEIAGQYCNCASQGFIQLLHFVHYLDVYFWPDTDNIEIK